jgi:hypothetical protein
MLGWVLFDTFQFRRWMQSGWVEQRHCTSRGLTQSDQGFVAMVAPIVR